MISDNVRQIKEGGRFASGSLAEGIYEEIRDKIMTCRIAPDDILVEGKLAEEYKVSKTPVREALVLLKRDGLLEVLPRLGYRVTSINVQDVYDVFRLRWLLEGEAAFLAAERASTATLERLQEENQKFSQELMRQNLTLEEYLRLHDSFHLRIAQLSGSKRLLRFIEELLRDGTRLRLSDPIMSAKQLAKGETGHEQIYYAICKRNAEEARSLVHKHIEESKKRILLSLMRDRGNHSLRLI